MIDIDRALSDARQADGMRAIERAIDLLENAAPSVDVISEGTIGRMVEKLRGIVSRNRSRVVLRAAAE